MRGAVVPEEIEDDLVLDSERIIRNPDDGWFIEYLAPYYIITRDNQYLFASTQAGRRPDRVFYMVPEGYKLGKRQRPFDREIGRRLYEVVKRYLKGCKVLVQEGIQGEVGYKTGLRIIFSLQNPHTAYIAWMGLKMVYPPEEGMGVQCWNYIVPERLPDDVVAEIHGFWPEFDPDEPLTLYDLTEMERDVRRVMSLRVDYFGGAFKKPNLTMVWNRGESEGFISYHGGATEDRILKGLSGTGKTTLTVGPSLQQDDACLGQPYYEHGKITKVQLIGLEAASFAKSEGLVENSPEWPGLMKSRETNADGSHPIVLAMNIDCEGVEYRLEEIAGYMVKVPRQIPGEEIGSLQCTRYAKSSTTNGRFIFKFSEVNPDWAPSLTKWLKSECLSFRRFDVMEPIFRVIDPAMAVALDSACESVITSAVAGKVQGTRVRSYAATDFMVGEQSRQALAKLRMYSDLGLGPDGRLLFFIVNTGYVGEYDIEGRQIRVLDEKGKPIIRIDEATGQPDLDAKGTPRYVGRGEKITVADSKRLVDLVEHRKIKNWITHPVFGYLIPEPRELEERHGMADFRKRFNLLRYYSPEQIIEFYKRDIAERTDFLRTLFAGQTGEAYLKPVIEVWERYEIPDPEAIRTFYEEH
ncbi:MAG: hypothetical protein MUP04_06740 [Anaerolineae bacterium]|nr:hypothetical protein [Anaerolineae bacterium]